MAVLDKSTYLVKYNDTGTGLFKDQTNKEITATRARTLVEDTKDSAMFLSDNFIDEDSFASDSATKAPSQQSTKAYVATRINTVTVTVSSAEILAIFTSPKTLLAAPAAGTVYMILSVMLKYHHVANAYATNTNLVIRQGTGRNVLTFDSLLMNAAASKWQTLPVNDPGSVGTSNPEAAAIILTHASGNPTGGDGTLSIAITYSIATF